MAHRALEGMLVVLALPRRRTDPISQLSDTLARIAVETARMQEAVAGIAADSKAALREADRG